MKRQVKVLEIDHCVDCKHHYDYVEWSHVCLHPEIMKTCSNPNGRPMSVTEARHFPRFCPLEDVTDKYIWDIDDVRSE